MRIFAPLCLLIFLFACETSEKQIAKKDASKYSLEIVDSIQVDRLIGTPSIVSVHPETENLLLLANEGDKSMVLIINQDGEVVNEFEHLKEGPTSAGELLVSANFYEDGFVIIGYGNILTYDADFNVKKRLKIPYDNASMVFIYSNHPKFIERDGRPHLLIHYGPATEKSIIDGEFYDEYNLLALVDLENEKFETFGQFHEGSIFRSGRAYYIIQTFFQTIGNQAKAIAGYDSVLYTFDNRGNEVKRTTIPFDEYVVFKGYTIGPAGLEEQGKSNYTPGRVTRFLHADGFDVFTYRSGFTTERMDQYRNPNGAGYDREAINEANPQKIIILKDGKQVSNVSLLPEKISSLSASDRSGNIWATQNVNALEKEPELVTIYKLRIVEN